MIAHKNKVMALFIGTYLVFLLVLQIFFFAKYIPDDEGSIISSNVYGEVKFCINHPPFLNGTCNLSAMQNINYSCKFNASDLETTNLTFFSTFITSPTVFVIGQNGQITYTPNSSHSGNHTVYIGVYDDSACANNEYAYITSFEVLNENDPPYLITDIPDQSWTYGTIITPFDLDNYFYDPDRDRLTYTTAPETVENINISIDSNNRVTFTALNGFTGVTYVTFYAWDPFYANSSSNEIRLMIGQEDSGDSDSNTGGGGGGGGGSSAFPSCLPKWYCRPWGVCEPDNLRRRDCNDLNNCSTIFGRPNLTEPCEFISSCFDGFLGPDEENIDCGGPCPPCGSCEDNACNNGEDCTKGITNIPDCGGNCKPCLLEKKETCFDKICNNEEDCTKGITNTPDCGGNCMPCIITEMPIRILEMNWMLLLILLLLGILSMHLAKRISLYINEVEIKKRSAPPMLDKESTKALYEDILEIERLLSANEIEKVLIMFSEIVRKYFKSLLKLKYECTFEEIFKEIKLLKLSESFTNVLLRFFDRSTEIEFSGKNVSKNEMSAMIEEFKQIVSLTSTIKFKEEQEKIRKISPTQTADRIFFMISSAESDLRNKRLNEAYDKYLAINNEFKKLEQKDKLRIHGFASRLYEEIKLARELYSKNIR